jgi:hypothetical protein
MKWLNGSKVGLLFIVLLSMTPASLAAEGVWTRKANMPTARFGLTSSVVDGKIYAVGGATGPGTDLRTIEEYNPTTDSWMKKADMPTTRCWHSTSAVNGKIYAIGGFAAGALSARVEEYDPAKDTWTRKADMPTPRWALSTSTVNGKIYAIGGNTERAFETCISTVEEYDPNPLIFDLNGDLNVNFKDFSILARYWQQDQSPFLDHRVDYNDLAVFTDYWLKGKPPRQASNPHPANYTEEIDVNVGLSWVAGIGATSYDVYFGTSSPSTFQGNQTDTTFDPGTLVHSSTYYWRIDAVNGWGKTTGTVWSFTTIYSDLQANNPNPSNGAYNVSITDDLSWMAGADATSHDVYFGTSNPPPFLLNQPTTIFDLGTMDYSTTYYWRIDEVGAYGSITGTAWSFSTMSPPPP